MDSELEKTVGGFLGGILDVGAIVDSSRTAVKNARAADHRNRDEENSDSASLPKGNSDCS